MLGSKNPAESTIWQQGGPAGITFQRAAAGVMVMREARPEAEKARHGKVGGPGTRACLMLLSGAVQASAGIQRYSFWTAVDTVLLACQTC